MFIRVFTTTCHLLLSHTNPAHFLPAYLFTIHIYTICCHKPWSAKWSLSFKFHHLNSLCTAALPIGATGTAHLVLLDLFTRTLGEEVPDSRRETTKFPTKTLVLLVDYVLLISAFLFNRPFIEQYKVSISSLCDIL